jgi:hypothetical protein
MVVRPRLGSIRVSLASAVVIGAVALLAMSAAPAAAVSVFTMSIEFNSSCVNGTAPDNDAVTVTLKDDHAHVLGVQHATASASGYWNGACFQQVVEPGNSLTVSDSTHSRTLTAPALTAALNRTTDVQSGIAPKNSHLTLTLEDCGSFICEYKGERTVTASASGTYHTDWTSLFNVRGDDYVYATWTSPNGDSVDIYSYSPYVYVTLGDAEVSGTMTSGQTGTVTLKHGTTVRGTAHIVGGFPDGSFDSGFRNNHGVPVAPNPGDTVLSSFGTSFTLANLAVSGNASTDMVTGTCPPNRAYEVYAHDATPPYRPSDYSYQYGTANGSGHVSVDTQAGSYSAFDLQSGDQVSLYCSTSSGDAQIVSSIVP